MSIDHQQSITTQRQNLDATHPIILLILGASGTQEYSRRFTEWAGLWKSAAESAGAEFITIGTTDQSESMSDRERLERSLEKLASQQSVLRPLWLVLIGHGTFDGRNAKFNLRGPDVSADQLAAWLKPLDRPLAILNTASASAPFISKLSAPGRVIITATRSGHETNFTRFGQYIAKAIADPDADLDKDNQASLLEAFLAASRRTQRFYETQGRLATEHALIDDNGDGHGTPADAFRGVRPTADPTGNAAPDGYRAHQMHLIPSRSEQRLPPDLRARRNELEMRVFKLRDRKEQLSDEEYYRRLEPLLLKLARIYHRAE